MSYIPELLDFLAQLSENNNRPWFKENKGRFDALRSQWMADMEKLRGLMMEWEPELARQPFENCIYRIYRDTRFSPDKTPYKTYVSAIFSRYGRKSYQACYYFQLGVDEATTGLYGGMWCPPSDCLRRVRSEIVANIEEFRGILDNSEFAANYPGWIGESLKTVPKGWDRNHPDADLLRLKDFGKFHHCSREFFLQSDWVEQTSELFRLLKPFNDFLNFSLESE